MPDTLEINYGTPSKLFGTIEQRNGASVFVIPREHFRSMLIEGDNVVIHIGTD